MRGSDWGWVRLGSGDAEHALAKLALDQLPAEFFRDGKVLAALEIGTKQLH